MSRLSDLLHSTAEPSSPLPHYAYADLPTPRPYTAHPLHSQPKPTVVTAEVPPKLTQLIQRNGVQLKAVAITQRKQQEDIHALREQLTNLAVQQNRTVEIGSADLKKSLDSNLNKLTSSLATQLALHNNQIVAPFKQSLDELTAKVEDLDDGLNRKLQQFERGVGERIDRLGEKIVGEAGGRAKRERERMAEDLNNLSFEMESSVGKKIASLEKQLDATAHDQSTASVRSTHELKSTVQFLGEALGRSQKACVEKLHTLVAGAAALEPVVAVLPRLAQVATSVELKAAQAATEKHFQEAQNERSYVWLELTKRIGELADPGGPFDNLHLAMAAIDHKLSAASDPMPALAKLDQALVDTHAAVQALKSQAKPLSSDVLRHELGKLFVELMESQAAVNMQISSQRERTPAASPATGPIAPRLSSETSSKTAIGISPVQSQVQVGVAGPSPETTAEAATSEFFAAWPTSDTVDVVSAWVTNNLEPESQAVMNQLADPSSAPFLFEATNSNLFSPSQFASEVEPELSQRPPALPRSVTARTASPPAPPPPTNALELSEGPASQAKPALPLDVGTSSQQPEAVLPAREEINNSPEPWKKPSAKKRRRSSNALSAVNSLNSNTSMVSSKPTSSISSASPRSIPTKLDISRKYQEMHILEGSLGLGRRRSQTRQRENEKLAKDKSLESDDSCDQDLTLPPRPANKFPQKTYIKRAPSVKLPPLPRTPPLSISSVRIGAGGAHRRAPPQKRTIDQDSTDSEDDSLERNVKRQADEACERLAQEDSDPESIIIVGGEGC